MFKIVFWPMQPPCTLRAHSVHAGLLLSKAWAERAQCCMGQNTILNMFLFLKHFLGKNLNIHKISKQNNKKKNQCRNHMHAKTLWNPKQIVWESNWLLLLNVGNGDIKLSYKLYIKPSNQLNSTTATRKFTQFELYYCNIDILS